MANNTLAIVAIGALAYFALKGKKIGEPEAFGGGFPTIQGITYQGEGKSLKQPETLEYETPMQSPQIGYSDKFIAQAQRALSGAGISTIQTMTGISGRTNIATAGITSSELNAINKILPTKTLKSSGSRSNTERFEIGGKTYETTITVTPSKRGSDGLTDFERATTGKRAI